MLTYTVHNCVCCFVCGDVFCFFQRRIWIENVQELGAEENIRIVAIGYEMLCYNISVNDSSKIQLLVHL
jgi:hypothetical protein